MAIRIEYKVDDSQVKEAEEALKALNAETKKVEDSADDLGKTSKDVGKDIGAMADNVNIAGMSLGDLKGKAGQAVSGLGNIGKSLRSLNGIIKASVIGIVVTAIVSLGTALTKTTEVLGLFNKAMGAVNNVINTVIARVGLLGRAVIKAFQGDFSGAVDLTKQSVDNLGSALVEAAEKGAELAETRKEFERLNRVSSLLVATLENQRNKLEQLRDDATLSFKAREQAALQLQRVEQRIADENLAIARRNLEAFEAEYKASGLEIVGSALDTQNELKIALANAEAEQTATIANAQRERNQLVQDRLERDLDILIDGLDRQKTINEQQLASDQLTYQQKQDLINETQALADKSFAAQVKIAEELAGKEIAINELIKESDATVLLEKIRAAELSEIAEGRILEIVNERKQTEADLAMAQTEIDAEELEKQVENYKKAQDEKAKIDEKAAAEREKKEEALRAAKLDAEERLKEKQEALTQEGLAFAQSVFAIIAKENRAAAIAALAADKVVAIAKVGIELQKELAAISSFSATLGPGAPAYIAAAGTAAKVRAGFRIATITAQGFAEAQQFADGVINLEGGVRGKDSIPAMLMPGESVMTTQETNDFLPTLSAIRKGDIAPELLNGIVQGGGNTQVIEVPRDSLQIDENGFTLRQVRKSYRISKKLNRYRL